MGISPGGLRKYVWLLAGSEPYRCNVRASIDVPGISERYEKYLKRMNGGRLSEEFPRIFQLNIKRHKEIFEAVYELEEQPYENSEFIDLIKRITVDTLDGLDSVQDLITLLESNEWEENSISTLSTLFLVTAVRTQLDPRVSVAKSVLGELEPRYFANIRDREYFFSLFDWS